MRGRSKRARHAAGLAFGWAVFLSPAVRAEPLPVPQVSLPTASTSTTVIEPGAPALDVGLAEEVPVWRTGWFWAVVSTAVAGGVVGGVVASRSGPRCFCLTPEGQPCSGCE